MGNRAKYTFLERKHMSNKQVSENLLNSDNHQGNAIPSHNEKSTSLCLELI